ncbi:unnamed protein product [Soboliphyme baturini]|uniref:Uncharacterized protein n=1 Tax=Soboliphyme baturini TaxID=241478 RepID=A0A183J7I2_9BILA|nr:unnamed protein product [Soboliphyme baturini]
MVLAYQIIVSSQFLQWQSSTGDPWPVVRFVFATGRSLSRSHGLRQSGGGPQKWWQAGPIPPVPPSHIHASARMRTARPNAECCPSRLENCATIRCRSSSDDRIRWIA